MFKQRQKEQEEHYQSVDMNPSAQDRNDGGWNDNDKKEAEAVTAKEKKKKEKDVTVRILTLLQSVIFLTFYFVHFTEQFGDFIFILVEKRRITMENFPEFSLIFLRQRKTMKSPNLSENIHSHSGARSKSTSGVVLSTSNATCKA